MLAGIIITVTGDAQVFGTELDFIKLAAVVKAILPQLEQGADAQRKEQITKLLSEVDRSALEAALTNKAE